jgi:hypothetical protein
MVEKQDRAELAFRLRSDKFPSCREIIICHFEMAAQNAQGGFIEPFKGR